jgi:hypothetical protein
MANIKVAVMHSNTTAATRAMSVDSGIGAELNRREDEVEVRQGSEQ